MKLIFHVHDKWVARVVAQERLKAGDGETYYKWVKGEIEDLFICMAKLGDIPVSVIAKKFSKTEDYVNDQLDAITPEYAEFTLRAWEL